MGGRQTVKEGMMADDFEVSQSRIKSWRRCHAQYDYRYNQKLERKKPKLQLVRGTMIGKCIDLIVEKRTTPKSKADWKTVLADYEKEYGKYFDEEREYYGDIIGEVRRIVERYEVIYKDDGLVYQPGPVKGSKPYELEIRHGLLPGIVFTAHFDKYPMDKHKRYWNMDHKTHRSFPDEKARFSDLQLAFYFWLSPLVGLPKPTGIVWDYIRTKPPAIPEELKNGGLSQRKNIDTDYDTYMAEIKKKKLSPADYQEILTQLKPEGHFNFYRRIWLPGPSKTMVENIVRDTKITAQEMKSLSKISKARNMTYQCSGCSYFELCQAEVRGVDSDFIRKTQYTEVKEVVDGRNKEEE